jgi:hypothetical protein
VDVSRQWRRPAPRSAIEPIPVPDVAHIPAAEEWTMALKGLAREHLGRGSVLGFVLILTAVVLVLLAIFWPVA